MLMSDFIVEHNIPVAVADHIGPLLRHMFLGNEIAKKYGAARTKTSALIGHSAQSDIKYI